MNYSLTLLLLSPWFILGWVGLFIALTADRKPKRDLDSANDLLRQRNRIGAEQIELLARIAECLETLTKEDKP